MTKFEINLTDQQCDVLSRLSEPLNFMISNAEIKNCIQSSHIKPNNKFIDFHILQDVANHLLGRYSIFDYDEYTFSEFWNLQQKVKHTLDFFGCNDSIISMPYDKISFMKSLGKGNLRQRIDQDLSTRRFMAVPGYYNNDPYAYLLNLYNVDFNNTLTEVYDTEGTFLIYKDRKHISYSEMCQYDPKSYEPYIKDYFQSNICTKLSNIFGADMPWHGTSQAACTAVIAGGFIAGCIYGKIEWPNACAYPKRTHDYDIDVFLCHPGINDTFKGNIKCSVTKECQSTISNIIKSLKNYAHTRNAHVIAHQKMDNRGIDCYICGGHYGVSIAHLDRDLQTKSIILKIQIITHVYETPSHIIHGFDLEPSKAMFNGVNTYVTQSFVDAMKTNTILLDETKLSKSWLHRYYKYITRYKFNLFIPGINLSQMQKIHLLVNSRFALRECYNWTYNTPITLIITRLLGSIHAYSNYHSTESDYTPLELDANWSWVVNAGVVVYGKSEHVAWQIARGGVGSSLGFTGAFNPIKKNIYVDTDYMSNYIAFTRIGEM